MHIFGRGPLFCLPQWDATFERVVSKGFSEELALKARPEGQEEGCPVESQKSFSSRGSSMCKDPGAGKSLAYQEAEGSPE